MKLKPRKNLLVLSSNFDDITCNPATLLFDMGLLYRQSAKVTVEEMFLTVIRNHVNMRLSRLAELGHVRQLREWVNTLFPF